MLVWGPATVGKQFSSRLREFIVRPEPAPEAVAYGYVAQKRPWKEAVILAPKQGTASGGICWNKDILCRGLQGAWMALLSLDITCALWPAAS